MIKPPFQPRVIRDTGKGSKLAFVEDQYARHGPHSFYAELDTKKKEGRGIFKVITV